MSSCNLSYIRDTKRIAELTPDIEILASNGKIGSFRHDLRIASPILHQIFEENPNLTIIDLKNELKLRGLPVSGKKSNLIQRLKNDIEEGRDETVIEDSNAI